MSENVEFTVAAYAIAAMHPKITIDRTLVEVEQ
jgi:hypothetical protein